MTMLELKKRVDFYAQHHRDWEEYEVRIRVEFPAQGRQPTVGVDSAGVGCDWDSGKLIIYPEHKLVKQRDNE